MHFTPSETDFIKMVQEKIAGNHFTNHVGYQINHIEAGMVMGELDLKPHHLQQMGFVHGGITATFADVVAGFAAFTLVKKGQNVVTADLKVSYLNPGIGTKIFAKGWVIKAGQKLHFCEALIWMENAEGLKIDIAKSSSTMVVV